MSSDSDNLGKFSGPYWDGTRETFANYFDKFEALADYNDATNAMTASGMTNCPTKSEFDGLDKTSTDAGIRARIKLYNDNKKLCSIFALGQNGGTGMAALKSTKTPDFPSGLIHQTLTDLSETNKPNDVTAEIELENEIGRVKFSNANDYHTEVTGIMSSFECKLTDTQLIKIMVKKVQNTTYTKDIMTELEKATPSFKTICNDIAKIQRLARATDKTTSEKTGKEVALYSTETTSKKGKCSYCGNPHKRKDCNKLKAALKKQGPCPVPGCGKEGHLESECFIKHPEKKPKWHGKSKAKKSDTEVSNTEVMIVNVDESDFA